MIEEKDLDLAYDDLHHAAVTYTDLHSSISGSSGISNNLRKEILKSRDALRENALKYAAAVCRALGDAESNQWTFCAKLLEELAADYGED